VIAARERNRRAVVERALLTGINQSTCRTSLLCNSKGVAAAIALRARAGGSQTTEATARFDEESFQ